MIAVIRTGGKQYTVAADETHEIEKIEGEAGARLRRTNENPGTGPGFRRRWRRGWDSNPRYAYTYA